MQASCLWQIANEVCLVRPSPTVGGTGVDETFQRWHVTLSWTWSGVRFHPENVALRTTETIEAVGAVVGVTWPVADRVAGDLLPSLADGLHDIGDRLLSARIGAAIRLVTRSVE